MFIETTFMRYGHGPRGIIGITLKPETLKTWALGLHICSRLEQDIAEITEGERVTKQETHKEETTARIRSEYLYKAGALYRSPESFFSSL